MLALREFEMLERGDKVTIAQIGEMLCCGEMSESDIEFEESLCTFPLELSRLCGREVTLRSYDDYTESWLVTTDDEWSLNVTREMISDPIGLTTFNIPVKCSTSASAGFDIAAHEACTIEPGETKLVRTNLYFSAGIADDEYLAIMSRSGLALKQSVFVLNAPGVVDADYTGEICVILHNAGTETFIVDVDDRVAQGVIMCHTTHQHIPTATTKRGNGGFGSTGK